MSSLPNPMDVFEQGTLVKGRYRVVDQVGSGGMAVVFLVHDEDLRGRPAVLKSPFAGPAFKAESLRSRFEEEIGNLIEVGHVDGVVDILDQGVHDDAPFYVAAWMGGGSLQERLGPQGRQEPDEVAAWLTPIAEALDAVHARKFVHRDVKPDNILFTEEDGARLADFGIARVFSGDATGLTTGYTRIGTQAYWAPEQEAGLPIDGRADQFGLAATVYRALAGQPPATRGVPKLVRELAPAVTVQCEKAIHRALETDRKKRFASCADFAHAFAEGITASVVRRTNQATRKVTGNRAQGRARTRAKPVTRPKSRTTSRRRPTRQRSKTSRKAAFWVAAPLVLGVVAAGMHFGGLLPTSPTQSPTQETGRNETLPKDTPTPKQDPRPEKAEPTPERQPGGEPWRTSLDAFVHAAETGNLAAASRAFDEALDRGAPATAIPAKLERAVLTWRKPPVIQVLTPARDSIASAAGQVSATLRWTAGRTTDKLFVGVGAANARVTATPRSGIIRTPPIDLALGHNTIRFEIRDGTETRWEHEVGLLYRRGGPTAHDDRIDMALRWLAAHQSPNGGWQAAGFPMWCDGEPAPAARQPSGAGLALYDVGVTGLALNAFLGAGYTNRGKHDFSRVVSTGMRYLKNVQDPEGCFGLRTTQQYVYNHATAALAMVTIYRRTRSPIFKGSAQRALDFIGLARNPYFAWRYDVKPGDNDTSVTAWMTSVLHTAALVNHDAQQRGKSPPLSFDEAAFEGVAEWVRRMTDPDYGMIGYLTRGSGSARAKELVDRFPSEKSEAMTAAGILSRMYTGVPASDPLIRKGANRVRELPPTWNERDGSIDMYYWFYGALAMHRIGGDHWRTWEHARKTAVIAKQRTDTDFCRYRGSWDPEGAWGPDGGRVYSTAMMALLLETELRGGYPVPARAAAPSTRPSGKLLCAHHSWIRCAPVLGGAAKMQVGDEIGFQYAVFNGSSKLALGDVTLAMTVGDGLTSRDPLSKEVRTIPPGGHETLRVRLRATKTGDVRITASSRDAKGWAACGATTMVRVGRGFGGELDVKRLEMALKWKLDSSGPFRPGQRVQGRVIVTNTGNVTLARVVVGVKGAAGNEKKTLLDLAPKQKREHTVNIVVGAEKVVSASAREEQGWASAGAFVRFAK